jgi:hypothetical protein
MFIEVASRSAQGQSQMPAGRFYVAKAQRGSEQHQSALAVVPRNSPTISRRRAVLTFTNLQAVYRITVSRLAIGFAGRGG